MMRMFVVGIAVSLAAVAHAEVKEQPLAVYPISNALVLPEVGFFESFLGQTFWIAGKVGAGRTILHEGAIELVGGGFKLKSPFDLVKTQSFVLEAYFHDKKYKNGVYRVRLDDGRDAFIDSDFIAGWGDTGGWKTYIKKYEEWRSGGDYVFAVPPEQLLAEQDAKRQAKEDERLHEFAIEQKKLSDEIAAIKARMKLPGVRIGMSKKQVLQSSWGEPVHVNKTVTALGTSEQWVYKDEGYLYFSNGKLTAIQH